MCIEVSACYSYTEYQENHENRSRSTREAFREQPENIEAHSEPNYGKPLSQMRECSHCGTIRLGPAQILETRSLGGHKPTGAGATEAAYLFPVGHTLHSW